MGQGNDRGSQYRSGIYCTTDEQKQVAEASRAAYQKAIGAKEITTEIVPLKAFYFAEDYHQQYLAKPGARPYCSAQPMGVSLPTANFAAAGSAHAPKLPEGFWVKHGPKRGCSVVREGNGQIKWEGFF